MPRIPPAASCPTRWQICCARGYWSCPTSACAPVHCVGSSPPAAWGPSGHLLDAHLYHACLQSHTQTLRHFVTLKTPVYVLVACNHTLTQWVWIDILWTWTSDNNITWYIRFSALFLQTSYYVTDIHYGLNTHYGLKTKINYKYIRHQYAPCILIKMTISLELIYIK